MEAKIEQLKEASDTQLIELSTTEKKRKRLLEKIKNLQTTVEDREELIEKLNRKIQPSEAKTDKKSRSPSARTGSSKQQASTLKAQTTALEAQAYELDLHKQKISQLSKKLETRSKTAADLKQEVGMGRGRITRLIRKIDEKDQQIVQLTREIATLKPPETSPSDEVSRKDNDTKISLVTTSAKQSYKPAKPLTPIAINSKASGSTPYAETAMGQSTHPKRRSEKKIKPVKTPDSLSLAQRIRALQAENPKSV